MLTLADQVQRTIKLRTGLRLIGGLAFTVLALVLVLVLLTDHASCVRSNSVRKSQLGEERYALDAAAARSASAHLEAKSNPRQAAVDREAARRFVADAAYIHIRPLDCSGLFPTEK